jgi:hypothetical protein
MIAFQYVNIDVNSYGVIITHWTHGISRYVFTKEPVKKKRDLQNLTTWPTRQEALGNVTELVTM